MENLNIDPDECCTNVNCTTPYLLPYSCFSEAKNYSATNFGISLPLSRKQPACRQAGPNASFHIKEPLT
jgi:hypothetical protein